MVIFRLVWLLCMLLQIFVLAWHANEIQLNSMGISQAVYECEWYRFTEKLKKYLLIIIMRAQRPLTLSVGPFFILTNNTAFSTVKAAYSYLAVLNNRRTK